MQWTRRRVLQALATSALTPAVASFLQACGGSGGQRRAAIKVAIPPVRSIRADLRAAVSELSKRFPNASALALTSRRGGAVADANDSHASQAVETVLILSGWDATSTFEELTSDSTPRGIEKATRALIQRAPRAPVPSSASAPGGPSERIMSVTEDPSAVEPGEWIRRVAELYDQARRVGGSRIVYRSAYMLFDDSEALFIGPGRDVLQRMVRTRAGVVFVAQQTAIASSYQTDVSLLRPSSAVAPAVEVAERSGVMGLEVMRALPEELDGAASRALSIISPLLPPSGVMDVLLEPSVAARIVTQCIAPALDARHWVSGESRADALVGQKIGSAGITLFDNPALARAYGSYFFDCEGQAAQPAALIQEGVLRGPFSHRRSALARGVARTSNARLLVSPSSRVPQRVVPAPSNLILAPGRTSRDELIGSVSKGLLLEGGLAAQVDLRTWRFSARAARAREIADGKLTGVSFGAVDIHGDIVELLTATRGLSVDRERFAGDPASATTVTCPYMLSKIAVSPAG